MLLPEQLYVALFSLLALLQGGRVISLTITTGYAIINTIITGIADIIIVAITRRTPIGCCEC